SKLERDVLPRCSTEMRDDLGTLLDSPVRSHRIDLARGGEPAMVYNFEVEADSEIDKNFVIFTSHYTPILVSNSHAAVVARGMGTPCVAGASSIRVDDKARTLVVDKTTIRQGDWISLDGSTGRVYVGQAPTIEAEVSGEFGTYMAWADEVRRL